MSRHITAILIFVFMSFIFMGTSLTSCQNTLIGSIGGDHISGIIWLFTFTDAPYGGFSHVTNYPFGENLAQPQLITSALHMVPAWVLAHIVGPMCAWNLMVFAGYMLSALMMYGFIYWLLRHRGVALFAGLAVGFTPYHYFKTMGHLSYIQSELFVAILWTFLAFWKNPTRNKGILLGALTGLLFYSDGYFPLIGSTMVGSLVLYGLVTGIWELRHKKNNSFYLRLRYLVVASLTTLCFLLPIFYVQLVYGQRIHASLGGERGNVLVEIGTYGARPADFILPSETHPVRVIKELVQGYRSHHVYSNSGEYTLDLGITVLALAAYCVFILIIRRRSKGKNTIWLRWVAGACLSIAIVAFLLSLIPRTNIFGLSVPLPSDIIGHLTGYWRVFARLYLVINIAVVTLASIGLWQACKRIKKPFYRTALVIVVILLTVFEFLPINPLTRTDQWQLKTASPTYWWLRQQKDIKAIAAYPLVEQPLGSTYFGDQVIHRKPLLNSDTPMDSQLLLHRALAGLGDGQTPGALRTLGINDVLLYRITYSSETRVLPRLYGNYGARVSAINSSVPPLNHILVPSSDFDRPVINPKTQISCRKSIRSVGTLNVRQLNTNLPTSRAIHAYFELRGQPGQLVIVYTNGQILVDTGFTNKDEIVPVDLTVSDNQAISIYHLSDPSAGVAEVCNLSAAL